MGTQRCRALALSSANTTPIPRHPSRKSTSVQSQPPTPRGAVLALISTSLTGIDNSGKPETIMVPIPQTPTDFENASLVHQKRLKVNSAQLRRVTTEFDNLKQRYLTTLTIPPTTTSAFRSHILTQLKDLCNRHEGLLDLRKDMLEKQQYWLEEALKVTAIQRSEKVLMALDLQIEAARDLAEHRTIGGLMTSLELT